jgi:WD40 repeat protein
MSTVPVKAGAGFAPKYRRVLIPNMVNSVAISDDGKRVVGGYYYYPYPGATIQETKGEFCTFCCDENGNRLWSDQYVGVQGIFAVAISADGKVAAGGGILDGPPYRGLLRAYDVDATSQNKTTPPLLDYQDLKGPDAPPNTDTGRAQRFGFLSLSSDGGVLAAAADKVYVFLRDIGSGKFSDPPTIITFDDAFNEKNLAQAVAVHPSGKWLAACDKTGHVCVATINGKDVKTTDVFTAEPMSFDRTDNNENRTGDVVLLCVAVSKDANSFVVGGGDFVYLFQLDDQLQVTGPKVYDSFAGELSIPSRPRTNTPQNVRWVAISDDGKCVTTVVNRYPINGQQKEKKGAVIRLDEELELVWQIPLERNPNSTSVDGAGKFVTVSDGYPVGTPSAFYLFDADTGKEIWRYPTSNMNWPMVISRNSKDGTGIAAGGDDGLLYYFG